ncbi:MAG: DMT family transporter [Acetobacteraceae bacterium]|nr:DMT family transporter [Acetobacteraceae bacterium]
MASQDATRGIALAVAAYGLFTLHDAGVKWLVQDLPVFQVLFVRTAVILAVCVAIGRTSLILRAMKTPLRRKLTFRATINLIAWLCFNTASRSLPLAQWLCLYFCAPLMVTVMAWRILRERVTQARWIAVTIGFAGVLFACDPFGVTPSLATLLVLISAALWGYGVILMRQIALHETTLLQMLVTNAIFALVTGVSCLWYWAPVTWEQTVFMLATGAIGGIAQFLVFEAARMTPASVLATVEYSALPWAFILEYMIWRDFPSVPIFIGAGLIIVAGAVLVRGERQL